MKKQNVITSVLAAQLVLLVPLIAMQFSNEWDWDGRDFIIVSILLAGLGVAYQLVVTGIKDSPRRALAGLALAGLIFLIWAELAVGVFGTPFAGS